MNKKRIIIFCGFIIVVVALVILYINTDFLKTKEQLFWKYFGVKKDEIAVILSNNEIKKYDTNLKNSSYIKEGSILVTSEHGFIGNVNAKILECGNKKEECKNTSIDVTYNNKNILNAQIIKDENFYFLKTNSDDSKYLAFENSNLKQLAKKNGIQNVELIPDSIKEIDFFELFSLSEEELKHISQKYIPICREHVENSDYIKNENNDMTVYELQLSKKQLKNLAISILDELYNDEYSLKIISNKARIIDEKSDYCDIQKVKAKISEIKQFIKRQNDDNEKFLSIIIYRRKNDVEKIELVLKDERTISIENADNKIIIKQYDIKNRKIEIDNISHIIETIINSITEITYEKNIANNQTCNVDINIKCNLGIDSIKLKYSYKEEIKTDIENLVRKSDIDYIELTNSDKNVYEMIVENLDKIN